jgi:hypothetical protein
VLKLPSAELRTSCPPNPALASDAPPVEGSQLLRIRRSLISLRLEHAVRQGSNPGTPTRESASLVLGRVPASRANAERAIAAGDRFAHTSAHSSVMLCGRCAVGARSGLSLTASG